MDRAEDVALRDAWNLEKLNTAQIRWWKFGEECIELTFNKWWLISTDCDLWFTPLERLEWGRYEMKTIVFHCFKEDSLLCCHCKFDLWASCCTKEKSLLYSSNSNLIENPECLCCKRAKFTIALMRFFPETSVNKFCVYGQMAENTPFVRKPKINHLKMPSAFRAKNDI